MRHTGIRWLLPALMMAATVSPVSAGDHLNLEEGLPVRIEDAYPIAFRGREVQGLVRYEHGKDGDTTTFRPVLEAGIWRNTQVAVESDLSAGSGDRTGSGDVIATALYNFNTETLPWPAFALKGALEFPTGHDAEGVDTTLTFIATKTLGQNLESLDRLHLNLAWRHNSEARESERDNHYLLGLGYSRRIHADAILVADYFFEQKRQEGIDQHLLELGVRYQWSPLTVLTSGIGAGIGEDSPDLRLTVGFQRSF